MARIKPIEINAATGRAVELLEELASRGGEPGPMVRAMANAPVVLRSYLDLNRAVKRGHIDRRVTERVNLAVHEWLGCAYCLAAHTRAARELGLSELDIELARQGTATDPKVAALVAYGQQLIAAPGEVTDEQVTGLREYGYTDEQIAEVVALVALQLLTGAFNLVAGIEPANNDESPSPKESSVSMYLTWAAATGAAGCDDAPPPSDGRLTAGRLAHRPVNSPREPHQAAPERKQQCSPQTRGAGRPLPSSHSPSS
jgi:AhpD family alkylhydroperoxidase